MGVNIGLLDSDFKRFTSRALYNAAKNVGDAERLNLQNLCLVGDKKLSMLHPKKNHLDVILPRFSSQFFHYGMLAVYHLEQQGIPVVNGGRCIETCQNKYYTSLALKKKKINQPNFAIALSSKMLNKHISKMQFPIIMKVLHGTEGVGAFKVNTVDEVGDWLETLGDLHHMVYLQDYLHQSHDYRLFVLGDQILYGYKRRLPKYSWKSNVKYRKGRGLKSRHIKVTPELKEFAFKCRDAVKAEICAIDYALVDGKPSVIEINQAPDFSFAYDKNIAKKIINLTRRKARR